MNINMEKWDSIVNPKKFGMTHKTRKNVKSSLLTLNKVRTKVNKPQSETNYHTLDKLSLQPKNLTIVETAGRSTFIIKKHLHHRYEEGGWVSSFPEEICDLLAQNLSLWLANLKSQGVL